MVIPREHSIQIKIKFWAICRKIQNVNFFQFLSFPPFSDFGQNEKKKGWSFCWNSTERKKKDFRQKNEKQKWDFHYLKFRSIVARSQIISANNWVRIFLFLSRNFKKDRNCRIFKRSYFWNRFLFYICIKLSILYISFNF